MRVRARLEYFGPAFSGWQLQANAETVQGELERSLLVAAQSIAKSSGRPEPERIVVMGSGRTDAGVHARDQVASFDWPFEQLPENFGKMLNGISRHELCVRSIEAVADDFDARRSPHIKTYSYTLQLGASPISVDRAWEIYQPLDLIAMARAARLLRGEHDFQSFRASDCAANHSVRVLFSSEVSRISANQLIYLVRGNGFLKQMIRIIIGTLVDVGLGRCSIAQFEEILQARDRSLAGATAPAHGLCLESVKYL